MTLSRLAEPALLTDQVFAAIRDAIMSGELPAGARLRLRDLAAQLGTSPMPVREAIGRLEQTGLVERTPHKGAVVTDLSLAELAHVYHARLVLEVEATRLGSVVLTTADAVRMRAELDQMMAAVRDGRVTEALDHDEALLTILYAAGGNPILVELIHDLWRRCRPFKIVGARRGVGSGSWSHQAPLIAAASAHDVEAATDITRQSLSSAGQRIQALLDRDSADRS